VAGMKKPNWPRRTDKNQTLKEGSITEHVLTSIVYI